MIGVALADGPVARWLEAEPSTVDCAEIGADGFFSRPSPYLALLAGKLPLLVRATTLSVGSPADLHDAHLAARVCESARARFVVHPLAYSVVDDTRLPRPVPAALTPNSLEAVAGNLRHATEALARPGLVEPITAPLRAVGSMPETAFLTRLCAAADCRLLIDVTTLLIASRNHGFDPRTWLQEIPGELIAAARIGGSSIRSGRWRHDPSAEIDDAAWTLLDQLLSRAQPEVLLLNHRDRPDGITGIEREVDRLRRAGRGPRAVASSPAGTTDTVQDADRPPAAVARPSAAATMAEPAPAPGTIEVAPDVALFVLDSEGVFVSETRHELTLFNTAATFVWCLLEDGTGAPGIAAAYAETFGLALDEAERHVGTILLHWFGRGYITHPGPLAGEPTSLTTALAWLLTNPVLRARFRQSPAVVAELLNVTHADRDMFTALDPGELDAQSEPDERETDEPEDALAAPSRTAATANTRQYRLLSTTFAVRADSEQVLDQIDEALGHLSSSASTPDVTIELRTTSSGGWLLLEDDLLINELGSEDSAIPAVKQLLRERAVDRHAFLLSVHAGAVAFGDACVLLPAAAGSGKTTLTAALVHAGATYFTDEIAILDTATLAVTPVPLSLTIKDGSIEPLRSRYPDIDTLTPHVREDYVHVRYLPPPPASLPDPQASAQARWIVFPHYAPDAATALHALDRPAALRRLLDESFVIPQRLDGQTVEALVQWMRHVQCFDLPFSSLDAAAQLIKGLAAFRRD